MPNNKKLIDLFQSKGLIFPITGKEVEEFERFNFISDDFTPPDWEAPEAILKRGIQKLTALKIENNEQLNSEIQELKMVARKGSSIPQHVIDKMKAKHKKNDK